MPFSANPFVVLTYVSGPAILTNASALLLMSTTNRFARVIDRSRFLAREIRHASPRLGGQLALAARRVRLIARALTALYVPVAAFAFATLVALVGAVASVYLGGSLFEIAGASALLAGISGFAGLVAGAVALVLESRLAVQAIREETDEALAMIRRAG